MLLGLKRWWALWLVLIVAGCGSSHDAGRGDAGRSDASLPDAASGDGAASDAGAPDAGGDGGMPVVCGGFLGDTCAPDEFCDYPDAAMCGAADGTGICKPRPEACPANIDPVCACDGMTTYDNACKAHAAGTDVLRPGTCEAPPDQCVDDNDCEPGTYCTLCWVNKVCIPDGAVC